MLLVPLLLTPLVPLVPLLPPFMPFVERELPLRLPELLPFDMPPVVLLLGVPALLLTLFGVPALLLVLLPVLPVLPVVFDVPVPPMAPAPLEPLVPVPLVPCANATPAAKAKQAAVIVVTRLKVLFISISFVVDETARHAYIRGWGRRLSRNRDGQQVCPASMRKTLRTS